MRKLLQYGFLLLFCYQLIGFFAFFEVEHYLIRKQVKKAIKLAVPENQLISFHFTIKESQQLKWVKPHEFRLHGRFYDVVHKELKNGIWHYHCINDIQETKLFERLSTATAVNLANTPPSHPMKGWLKVFEQAKELQDKSLSIYCSTHFLTLKQKDYFHYQNIYESHKVSVLERPPILV
ncbi:MAG: hypothetical protein ACKOWW_01080 [Flavobacteriales bacterium]